MRVSLAPSSAPDSSGIPFFSDATSTDTRLVGNVVPVKNSRGQIYALNLMNGAAATSYLQIFFRPASQVVLGTTAADAVIKLPTNAGSGFTQTLLLPVPLGGIAGASGSTPSGLSMAGTTTANGAALAAIGVTAIYV